MAEGAEKPPEAVAERAGLEVHWENVWLAVGSLLILGGIGVATAAWLHTAPATATEPNPPDVFDCPGTVIPFLLGVLLLVAGGIVLLAFFSQTIADRLPETLRERRLTGGVRPGKSSVSAALKPGEGTSPPAGRGP